MDTGLAAALGDAFDRLEDFVAVQSPLSTGDLGPVHCLQAAVGIGERERALLAARIPELASREQLGAVALGVLVGLLAAPARRSP